MSALPPMKPRRVDLKKQAEFLEQVRVNVTPDPSTGDRVCKYEVTGPGGLSLKGTRFGLDEDELKAELNIMITNQASKWASLF